MNKHNTSAGPGALDEIFADASLPTLMKANVIDMIFEREFWKCARI